MWRSESSKSVSIRGGDLVDVPPHLLAVVRVLGPVPSVMEVGDQGRDEFTADYLRPVERLEPGVTLDLLSSTTSSTKSSGAIPGQEGTTGTLRTLFTDWGGVFPTFQHLIDVLPKWSKTWNGPIIWRYCQKVLRKSFLKDSEVFLTKFLTSSSSPWVGGQVSGWERIMSYRVQMLECLQGVRPVTISNTRTPSDHQSTL